MGLMYWVPSSPQEILPVRKGAKLMDYLSSRHTAAKTMASGGSHSGAQPTAHSLEHDLDDETAPAGATTTSPVADLVICFSVKQPVNHCHCPQE
ncbi:hypothetical protein lerEdw1_016311 [Lerista edwardsae]|nr:hypothetical protein lerEdw1_016311 [Lerista edwardsae]